MYKVTTSVADMFKGSGCSDTGTPVLSTTPSPLCEVCYAPSLPPSQSPSDGPSVVVTDSPSVTPSSSAAPSQSQAPTSEPSDAPSEGLSSRVTVDSAIFTSLTDKTAISDAYVQAVTDVANGIFLPENRRRMQAGANISYSLQSCDYENALGGFYDCKCESEPLTTTQATAAANYVDNNKDEIGNYMKAKLGSDKVNNVNVYRILEMNL